MYWKILASTHSLGFLQSMRKLLHVEHRRGSKTLPGHKVNLQHADRVLINTFIDTQPRQIPVGVSGNVAYWYTPKMAIWEVTWWQTMGFWGIAIFRHNPTWQSISVFWCEAWWHRGLRWPFRQQEHQNGLLQGRMVDLYPVQIHFELYSLCHFYV